MSSNEEILAMLIAGIPRISERIARLTGQQKPKAFKAVELSYWQAAMDLDYAEDDARHLVGAVMDTLRAETAQLAGDETQVTADDNGSTSLERLMKLLVNSGSATVKSPMSVSAQNV